MLHSFNNFDSWFRASVTNFYYYLNRYLLLFHVNRQNSKLKILDEKSKKFCLESSILALREQGLNWSIEKMYVYLSYWKKNDICTKKCQRQLEIQFSKHYMFVHLVFRLIEYQENMIKRMGKTFSLKEKHYLIMRTYIKWEGQLP